MRPGLLIATAALASLMTGFAIYCTVVPQGWDAVIADPVAWDGQEVLLPLFTIEAIEGPDDYVLRRSNWRVPVQGPTADLVRGQDLSVRGTYDRDESRLVETWREHAPLRQGKRALGLGGILVFVLLLPSLFERRCQRIAARA